MRTIRSWFGRGRLVARFGAARLVRQAAGAVTLQGGSRADAVEAQEWISMFMHEAVLVAVHPTPSLRSRHHRA